MWKVLCTKLALIASSFNGLFTTIYMIGCSNSFYFKSMQFLFKFSPVIAYVILTNSLDGTSFCDGGEANAPSDAKAPFCDFAPNSESSNSSLTEEEKNLEKRDELIVKIGTGVIICTITTNTVYSF